MRTCVLVVAMVVSGLSAPAAGAGEADAEALLRKLADPDPKVREAAATEWLKQNLDPTVLVAPILKALRDENPKVRAAAADALAQLRIMTSDRESEPEVRKALEGALDKCLARQAGTKDAEALKMAKVSKNEAVGIWACKTFGEAEDIYRRTDWDGDGVLEYAQSFKGDFSLFERKKGSGDIQLLEPTMADAEGEPGGKANKGGYRFKVLMGQGPDAPGGRKSYVRNGNMTMGYALVAYPAEYGVTGRRTFLINNTGTVYGKDLGAETHAIVGKMTEYNPDKTWTPAE